MVQPMLCRTLVRYHCRPCSYLVIHACMLSSCFASPSYAHRPGVPVSLGIEMRQNKFPRHPWLCFGAPPQSPALALSSPAVPPEPRVPGRLGSHKFSRFAALPSSAS